MTVYIINFIVIIFFSIIYHSSKTLNKESREKLLNGFLFLIMLFMIAIQTFRGLEIGLDTGAYYSKFIDYGNMNLQQIFTSNQEVGFSMLIKITTLIGGSFNFFLFIISVLSIFPVFYLTKKYSPYPFLTIMLFISLRYYAFTFSGLRQSIAMGLTLLSVHFLINKKSLKFIILTIIASFFHISAILFLPVLFIKKLKINRNIIIVFPIAIMLTYLFRNTMYDLVRVLLFSRYEGAYQAVETGAFMWFFMFFLITVALLVHHFIVPQNENYQFFTLLLMVGSILLVFSTIGTNASRVADYYTIFSIIAIPMFLYNIKSNLLKVNLMMLTTVIVLVLFSWTIITDPYGINFLLTINM